MARHAPDVEHMVCALDAERMALLGDVAAAAQRYSGAAAGALRRGYVSHAALFHERHARILHATRRTTQAARVLERAIELYSSWGATAKVGALEADPWG